MFIFKGLILTVMRTKDLVHITLIFLMNILKYHYLTYNVSGSVLKAYLGYSFLFLWHTAIRTLN
jgi:hypothetical protein